MTYFLLLQDDRVACYPKIRDPVIIKTRWAKTYPIYCEVQERKSNLGYCSLPFISRPCLIISNKLKKIFEYYQIGQQFRPLLLDNDKERCELYYFFKPFSVDCISGQAEFYPDRTIKKLILNQDKIGLNKVFKIKGLLENFVVIDDEILELMLCEGIYPFNYKEVVVKRGEA